MATDPEVRQAYLGAGGHAEPGRARPVAAQEATLLTVRGLSAGYGAAIIVIDAI